MTRDDELVRQLRKAADSGDSDRGTSALMRIAAERLQVLATNAETLHAWIVERQADADARRNDSHWERGRADVLALLIHTFNLYESAAPLPSTGETP